MHCLCLHWVVYGNKCIVTIAKMQTWYQYMWFWIKCGDVISYPLYLEWFKWVCVLLLPLPLLLFSKKRFLALCQQFVLKAIHLSVAKLDLSASNEDSGRAKAKYDYTRVYYMCKHASLVIFWVAIYSSMSLAYTRRMQIQRNRSRPSAPATIQ